MNDIKDVKPPIDLPGNYWWLFIVAAILLAGVILYFYWRKQSQTSTHPAVEIPLRPSWEIAFERLQELEKKNYPAQGLFKPFYSSLSDIVRHYLEDRFQIKAPEMTTEEFLIYVRHASALNDEQKAGLRNFLNGCDMVKFAKFEPSAHDATANFQLAKKLVEETTNGI